MFLTSITRPSCHLISSSLCSKLNLLHTISSALSFLLWYFCQKQTRTCTRTVLVFTVHHIILYYILHTTPSYHSISYRIIPHRTASVLTLTHSHAYLPTFFHGKEIMVHINSIKINFLSKKAIRYSPLLTIFIHFIVFYFHTFYINTNLCLLLQFWNLSLLKYSTFIY